MNAQAIQYHKVNPKCSCCACFVKDAMDRTGASFREVLSHILKLQEDGEITIDDFDNEGFPKMIIRNISIKEIKKRLRDVI